MKFLIRWFGNKAKDNQKVFSDIVATVFNKLMPGPLSFEQELTALINRYSKDVSSNTPDFVLAYYLSNCLRTYKSAVSMRDKWHNHD